MKPWKGLCCSACYNAKTDKNRCVCRCNGAYHGRGIEKAVGKIESKDKSESEVAVTNQLRHDTQPVRTYVTYVKPKVIVRRTLSNKEKAANVLGQMKLYG